MRRGKACIRFERVRPLDIAVLAIACLLIIDTVTGISSFAPGHGYDVTNQYGSTVTIWGAGLYAHDSYFKAPVFIGTDVAMLAVVVPWLIVSWVFSRRSTASTGSRLSLMAALALVVYDAASEAFGITFNYYELIYIALFGLSLFALVALIVKAPFNKLAICYNEKRASDGDVHTRIGGVRVEWFYAFCVAGAIALIVAWLPDILQALFAGGTLARIETYTTEITYALDMGIISPCLLVCAWLLHKRRGEGIAMLFVLLAVCVCVGIMLSLQTVFQLAAGVTLTIAEIIAKVASFIALAACAAILLRGVRRSVKFAA
ncbi:MAG: hypothetical protein LBM21_00315 [Coriobacteriales bacterium]|jgi:hypothetical protein|nr:hypothetical protein [Coriobacteriales bacterium]